MSRMALDVEQESKACGGVIRGEIEKVLSGFGGLLEAPLAELATRQSQVQGLLQKVESERNLLRKLLTRAEMMCKALDEKVPLEEVLSEMRERKYTDARSLLAQGLSIPKVAAEVDLSESEIRLLSGITSGASRNF